MFDRIRLKKYLFNCYIAAIRQQKSIFIRAILCLQKKAKQYSSML